MNCLNYFCLLSLIVIVHGNGPDVIDAYYNIKEVDLLGTKVAAATVTYTFDQDLYLYTPPTCPGVPCDANIDTCYCDFTQNGCGTSSCDGNCTLEYCDDMWTDINVDGSLTRGVLEQDEEISFRFLISNPCQGWRLNIISEYGSYFSYLKYGEPVNTSNYDFSRASIIGPSEWFICPNSDSFRVGTWFLTIRAGYTTSFGISITPQTLPIVKPETGSCVLPNELAGTHICLEDSVPYSAGFDTDEEVFTYFYFEFTGCQHIMMTLSGNDHGADFDFYGSYNDMNNIFPYYLNSTFASYRQGDEHRGLTLCPPTGAEKGFIIINVDFWQPGIHYSNYTLYMSASATDLWKLTPISSIEKTSYYSALSDAASIELPTGNKLYCDNVDYTCNEFWFSSPSDNAIIFWPVPSLVRQKLPYRIYGNLDLDINPKNKTFTVGILVSYDVDGVTNPVVDRDYLSQLELTFNGLLTNNIGEPVLGSYKARYTETHCDYQGFLQIKNDEDNMITELGTTTNSVDLNTLSFRIDLFKFDDNWFGCQTLLSNMLTTSNYTIEENSTTCEYAAGTPEYDSDPCCNYLTGWDTTCVPRPVRIVADLNEINGNLVNQQCNNPECIKSFLQDYDLVVDDADICNVSPKDLQVYNMETEDEYQGCKILLENVECYSDADCGTFSCDMLNHICKIPFSFQEEQFVYCVVESMDTSQALYLKQYFNLTNITDTETLALSTLSKLRSQHNECIGVTGLNLQVRTHYQYALSDNSCSGTYQCPDTFCEDKSCPLTDNSCIIWCSKGGASWITYPSTEKTCLNEVYCNWDSELCQGKTMTECQQLCAKPDICAICENGQDCVEFPLSQQECAATTVCLLPNGTYALNMTESECNAVGKCSKNCPDQCQSIKYPDGVCFSDNETPNSCSTKGGIWDSPICHFPTVSKAQCSIYYGIYQSCTDLSPSQCLSCQYNSSECIINQIALACALNRNVECTNETLCSTAGTCSDSELLVDFSSTPIYGACIYPRKLPIGTYAGSTVLPMCLPNEFNFPNGCITSYAINETYCNATGGTWWFPAISEQQCTSVQGCYDIYLPTLQRSFSPKNEANCTSEYNYGTYQPYFEWAPAKWYSGVTRSLSWIPAQANTRYTYGPSIDLTQLYSIWEAGAYQRQALQLKSEALCKHTRSSQALATISCDCSQSSNGQQCFQSAAAVPVAESKPCVGAASTISTPSAVFSLTNTSVSVDCVDLVFFQVSALQFQETPKIRLSTNFALFKQPNAFSLRNSNKEPIGTLLGDGTFVAIASPLTNVQLCLDIRDDLSKLSDAELTEEGYIIYDFATSDSTYSTLTPIETNAYRVKDKVCSNFEQLSGSQNYFPILRVKNWREKPYFLFDSSSLGYIYTLAALFTVVTVAALLKIVTDSILQYKRHNGRLIELVQLDQITTFFIFLFNLIRAIYFFELPNGYVDSPVGDYVLVILPTFFFFSSFSTIIVLWAVTVIRRLNANKKSFTRLVRIAGVGVNVLLYLLFIIIVLVFQFSQTDSVFSCGGRVDSNTNLHSTQRDISIAYSAIVAIISLAIGIGFGLVGIRMYKVLTISGLKSGRNHQKLFGIAAVCSISFILHCFFILIVSGLEQPVIAFSFFGLLFTEVVPSAFIVAVFWRSIGRYTSSSRSSDGTMMSSKSIALQSKSLE